MGGITSLIFPFKNSENLFKIYFSALEHFFILGEKPNSKKFSELLNNIIIDYTGTKLFPLRRMHPPPHPPLPRPSIILPLSPTHARAGRRRVAAQAAFAPPAPRGRRVGAQGARGCQHGAP